MRRSFAVILLLSVCGMRCAAQQGVEERIEKIQKGIWKIRGGRPEAFDLLSVASHEPMAPALEKLGEGKLPFAPSEIKVSVLHGRTYIRIPLQKEEQLYGLGLNFQTVQLRGHLFRLHMDHYGGEDNGRDHAPVPFFISSRGYGVLINSARYIDVYAGSAVRTDSKHPPVAIDRVGDEASWQEQPYSDNVEILVPADGVELYLFAGPTMMNVVQRFNLFCGGGVLPPKWGLGFWFRPWYKEDAAGAVGIAKKFEAHGFPLDVLGLEPGWQSKVYPCSYEWRKTLFPDPKGFVQELLARNVRTNLWLNPYVSPEATIDGSLRPYYGTHTVWVGGVPDYTIPAARKIFQQHLEKNALDIGVSGFKIDEVDGYDRWLWPDVARFPSGRDGEQMRQTYGLQMMRLSDELFRKRNQRTYGLIRAENAGAAAHPYVMYNDHYDHRQYIVALINSGFGGVLWTPEVRAGGSPEDWARRMQTVCLSPMAMINAFADSLLPWAFGEASQAALDAALLRMQLLPYLYSSFAQYHFEGKPVFRGINLLDGSGNTGEIKDEYMMGDYLLVAPLFAGEKERKVILPKGNWYDFYTGAYAGNDETITVSPGIEKIPLFVSEGGIIPMIPPIRQTAEWKGQPLIVRVYGKTACSSGLYDDDGKTFNYEKGAYSYKRLVVESTGGALSGRVIPVKEEGGWSYDRTEWKFMTDPVPGQAQQDNKGIEEMMGGPWSKLFFIERSNGKYRMGDTVSQYDGDTDFKHLSFDISNNKVLANMGVQGTLKNVSMYRDSYFANCGPKVGGSGGWPGVWAGKDNSSWGPYSFTVGINGQKYDLDTVGWDFKTGLLDNLFPVTRFMGPQGLCSLSLIAFAPLSPDGSTRVRGLVYGLLLQNNTEHALKGSIYLPKLFAGDRQQYKEERAAWALFDPYDYEVSLADAAVSRDSVDFDLGKGQSVWVPVVFSMLGDGVVQEINAGTSVRWLHDTREYFRKMMGRMETPQDPYLGEFYERQVMEAFGSIAMSAGGKIAGSNWGSYPTTRQIWMKDCFYSSLPFTQLDPLLAKKLIYWFSEYGVRPGGTTQQGGVNHSIGLSVSSLLLASAYYKYTGDKDFFTADPGLRNTWDSIVRELVMSRRDSAVWLFPSRFISDGPIDADYHTGSNVCAWKAIKGYARLLREVYQDSVSAVYYAGIADRVHEAILQRCTVDGPYGRQFIEGTYRDGRKPPMASDGEESDITLMPYYEFLSQDDPVYLNYMKFSLSEHNLIYEPQVHAITWFGVASTAPGYVKGLCAGVSRDDLFSEHGYYKEVRKVTDADGSIWWWCYGWAKEAVSGFGRSKQVPQYGKLVRGVPGKAGWFSGVYSSVFRSRFAGISYDAPARALRFAPFSPSTSISWSGLPVGGSHFDLYYNYSGTEIKAGVINKNGVAVRAEITVPVDPRWKKYEVSLNRKIIKDINVVTYLGQPAIRLQAAVGSGEGMDCIIVKK